MSNIVIDIEKIWTFLRRQSEFETAQTVIRAFVERVPQVIGPELLNAPVTVMSLARARGRVLKHQLESGYVRDLIFAHPNEFVEAHGTTKREAMDKQFYRTNEEIDDCRLTLTYRPRAKVDREVEDVTAFLIGLGGASDTDEKTAAEEAVRLFREGNLTIAGLLNVHPVPLLQFA
jgi:hypothetical protein